MNSPQHCVFSSPSDLIRPFMLQFMADKMGIPCRCVCGEYQIVYNAICIQVRELDLHDFFKLEYILLTFMI